LVAYDPGKISKARQLKLNYTEQATRWMLAKQEENQYCQQAANIRVLILSLCETSAGKYSIK